MMNKSKIDWCDFSWNPVTGCRHGCDYCYAAKQARRFSGDVRMNLSGDQIKRISDKDGMSAYILEKPFKNENERTLSFPAGFAPTLHEYRLTMPADKKKPASIFVCSMADLFGRWVPDEWIERVFKACEAAPWHTYLFLTKNPHRYYELEEKNKLPIHPNWWFGTSVTRSEQGYYIDDQRNTFISVEPLLEDVSDSVSQVDWIIVGAETGNRKGKVKPEREWIESIVSISELLKIPLLMKNSKELRDVWGSKIIQKYPRKLKK